MAITCLLWGLIVWDLAAVIWGTLAIRRSIVTNHRDLAADLVGLVVLWSVGIGFALLALNYLT